MKVKLVLSVLAVALLFLADANSYGMSAEDVALITKYAESGSASSQVLLAVAYLNGDGGLSKEPAKAAMWFEKAAVQGNGYAEARLGDLYDEGLGVTENLKLAFDWREKAANRGNVKAQCELAKMYLEGRGVQKDSKKALQWLDRSANEGNPEAQYLLGRIYHLGTEDVAANRSLSKSWLDKAALQGSENAMQFIHWIQSLGYRLEKAWYNRVPALQKLADDGDSEAQYQLAVHYEKGLYGMKKDVAMALRWYKRAAAGGHQLAMNALHRIYSRGLDGVAPDPHAAQEWADKAKATAH